MDKAEYTVGKGWRPLVDEATERLKKTGVTASGHFEKYGTLRFTVDTHTPEAAVILDEIEERSSRICEMCGLPGAETERSGWIKTLCPGCAAAGAWNRRR